MANPEQLKILKQGANAWNEWRKRNSGVRIFLRYTDLSGAKLNGFNLKGADFFKCDLRGAQFQCSNLSRANLTDANLRAADLSEANLRRAHLQSTILKHTSLRYTDLSQADLLYADLSKANLDCTDFTNAHIGFSIFGDNDLSTAKGLWTVTHTGPSIISIDTLYKSGRSVPDVFWQGCGVPDSLITYLPAIISAEQAIQFYTCFISHSHRDEDFARRLYSRMRDENLRVWYAPEDMKAGQRSMNKLNMLFNFMTDYSLFFLKTVCKVNG
jgi:hypothetical protein